MAPFSLNRQPEYPTYMPTCYSSFLDKFLTTVPVAQLDEADAFVKEVKFMCSEFMNACPVLLYKDVPQDARNVGFFRNKNRHRSLNETGTLLNAAVQSTSAFERGLDVYTTRPDNACIVILPDTFQLNYSTAPLSQFVESATLVDDPKDLGELMFSDDVSQLTERAQYVIASKVPFYYCIRI